MRKGITLIEIIITIGIVILMVAISIPSIGYFSDIANWSGKDKVVNSIFNLALSQSNNKYTGVQFYMEDDKQYAQIVEIDSNAYYIPDSNVIILNPKAGYKSHFISNKQIIYPVIDNEIIDVNSFYILFYRNQLRKHLYIYDNEQIVHSYKNLAIDDDIYAINRYLGNLIFIKNYYHNISHVTEPP